MELTLTKLILTGIAALLVGFSKTAVAGLGVVIVPLMASAFPAKMSTGVLLPMLVCGDIFAVAYYRQHAQWHILRRFLPWVLPGVYVGYLALGSVPDKYMEPALGALVLGLLVLKLSQDRLGERFSAHIPRQWWFSAVIGILAGFATMFGNVAGPVTSVYLLSLGLEKREFIGTGAWYYLIINLVKVPFSASLGLITPTSLIFDLEMAPLIILGALTGILVFKRISQQWFNRLILGLAALATLKMLFF